MKWEFFFSSSDCLDTEILSHEGLTELPISWCHVPWSGGASVTARDSERKGLAHQHSVGLPILSPVSAHAHPLGVGALNTDAHDIPCTRDVGDQNQVEVTEVVDGKPNPSEFPAWHSAQQHHNF